MTFIARPYQEHELALMSTEPENLVLQLLRDMRAEMVDMRADLKSDMADLRSDMTSLRADVASDLLAAKVRAAEEHKGPHGNKCFVQKGSPRGNPASDRST